MLIAGIATSNILMSWGQFGLIFAWMWGRNYQAHLTRFRQNKNLVFFSGIYLLFIAGLAHTENFVYGFHDLKVKLPLLVLPFLIGGFAPLSQKKIMYLLHFFLAILVFSCLAGIVLWSGILNLDTENARQYSPFISSIRLSTLMVLGIYICIWLFSSEGIRYRQLRPVLYIAAILLFTGFIFLLQSLTGIIVLIISAWLIAIIYLLGTHRKKIKRMIVALLVLIPVFTGWYLYHEIKAFYRFDEVDFGNLTRGTPDGYFYNHDTTAWQVENGHYVWIYFCNQELKQEWNKRSKLDYDGLTNNGWPVRITLIRFITSKGWKKNAAAVQKLDDEEIKAVENGIPNERYLHASLISNRIYEVIWEYYYYENTGDPNGKSLSMRLEFWKNGWRAVRHAPWTGYGTGDVRHALNGELIRSGSKLRPQYWTNPHQQYLSVALAVGIPGLAVFTALLLLAFLYGRKMNLLKWALMFITLLAMLDDDPLETQAGVTQLCLWFCLLYSAMIPVKQE